MKTINIFKAAAIMALVLFASCSKEEIKDSQENGVITLTVPAIEGFGGENAQSRTVFEFAEGDVTPPKVKWEVEDIIYIGYIATGTGAAGNKSLTQLLQDNKFTRFKCTNVDETTNVATFEGPSIVENANIAIYTQRPDDVLTYYRDNETRLQYGVRCNVDNFEISSDNSHLAKNDLLVSVFNTTDKTLSFKRVFGLIKFEFTFPEEVSGTGTFSCDKLKQTGVAYIDNNAVTANNTGSNLTINDISVEGNSLTFYTFAPMVNNRKTPTIKYTFQIGDKTYSASVTYTKDALIRANQATKISADLK